MYPACCDVSCRKQSRNHAKPCIISNSLIYKNIFSGWQAVARNCGSAVGEFLQQVVFSARTQFPPGIQDHPFWPPDNSAPRMIAESASFLEMQENVSRARRPTSP